MIQDIAPHKLYNRYDPEKKPGPRDRVFHFRRDRLLISDGKSKNLELPRVKDFPVDAEFTYLFRMDGNDYYLYHDEMQGRVLTENDVYREEGDSAEPVYISEGNGFEYVRLQFLREERQLVEKWQYFAAITAFHLYQWYDGARFCGRCGTRTKQGTEERVMICPKCGNHIYPKIVPAVIVGVTDGDRLLITRYAGRSIHYDALIAGFTEIGETLEENVRREVMEEAGLRVKNIRYYKSQPWGMVSDVLMGFYCDVDGSTEVQLRDGELGSARWVRRQDIQGQPDDMSLTNEMMIAFRDGKV